MEENKTPLVDEYLQSLKGLREAGTDDFFYTRLSARLEKKEQHQGWNFPLRPAWVIGCLAFLLTVNSMMLFRQKKIKHQTATSSPLQQVAQDYDLTIASSY